MQSNLQSTILAKGITQREVAKRAGLPEPRISDYIHGRRYMPPRHIIAICNVLNCLPEDIVGTSDYDERSVRY